MRPSVTTGSVAVRHVPTRGVKKAVKATAKQSLKSKVIARRISPQSKHSTEDTEGETSKKKTKSRNRGSPTGAQSSTAKRNQQRASCDVQVSIRNKPLQKPKIKLITKKSKDSIEKCDSQSEPKDIDVIQENVKKKVSKKSFAIKPKLKSKLSNFSSAVNNKKPKCSSPVGTSDTKKKIFSNVSGNGSKNISQLRRKPLLKTTKAQRQSGENDKRNNECDMKKTVLSVSSKPRNVTNTNKKSTSLLKSNVTKSKKTATSKAKSDASDAMKNLEEKTPNTSNDELEQVNLSQLVSFENATHLVSVHTSKPFQSSQAEDSGSPFARKQVIGKVKPIARVKGTIVSNVKSDVESRRVVVPFLLDEQQTIPGKLSDERCNQSQLQAITLRTVDTNNEPIINSVSLTTLNLETNTAQEIVHSESLSSSKSVCADHDSRPTSTKVQSNKQLTELETCSPKSASKIDHSMTSRLTKVKVVKKSLGKCAIIIKPKLIKPTPKKLLTNKQRNVNKHSKKTGSVCDEDDFENCTFSINEEKLSEMKKICNAKIKHIERSQTSPLLKECKSDDSDFLAVSSLDTSKSGNIEEKKSAPETTMKITEQNNKNVVQKHNMKLADSSDENKEVSTDDTKVTTSESKTKSTRRKAFNSGSKLSKLKSASTSRDKIKEKKHFVPTFEDSTLSKRRLKLFGFWTGPKRHRVASLNALAKVQCLYENENRTHMELGLMRTVERSGTNKSKEPPKKKQIKSEKKETVASSESEYESKTKVKMDVTSSSEDEPHSPPVAMTLRRQPGTRSDGKYWDPKSSTSSSEESENELRKVLENRKALMKANAEKVETNKQAEKVIKDKSSVKVETKINSNSANTSATLKGKNIVPVKRRRKRTEVVMDLRDMVVRKRMASLNATAILAASYERRSPKSGRDDSTTSDSFSSDRDSETQKKKPKSMQQAKQEPKAEPETSKNVDARGGGCSKQKVEVIVNQDTDVTITGVYSAHHSGFCTAQYRISSTSLTHATATTSTEQDSGGPSTSTSSGIGSYTPLAALSSMQPSLDPTKHSPQKDLLGGLDRRSGRPSAFSAPSPHHSTGYYQPAGPLIKEGREEVGGGGGYVGASGSAPPPAPYPPPQPYHAPSQPQPQLIHAGYGVGVGVGVGQYFPADLCYNSRYYGRPSAYPPPPPQPQPQPPVQEPQMLSPYYQSHCYHQSPPHRPLPYIPEAFRGTSGGPPCPCPMRTCPKNAITGPAVGASGPAQDAVAARPKASPAPALAPLAPPLRLRPQGVGGAVKREASPTAEVRFSPKKAGVAPEATLVSEDASDNITNTNATVDAPQDLKTPKLEVPSDPEPSPIPLTLPPRLPSPLPTVLPIRIPSPLPPAVVLEQSPTQMEPLSLPPFIQPQSPHEIKSQPMPEAHTPVAEHLIPPISTHVTPVTVPNETFVPLNGIGEHVKIQKRKKVAEKQKDKSIIEVIKTPVKRFSKLSEKVKCTIKEKKKALERSQSKTTLKKCAVIPEKDSNVPNIDVFDFSDTCDHISSIPNVPKFEERINNNNITIQKNGLLPPKNGIIVKKHSNEVKSVTIPPVTPMEPAKKPLNKRRNGFSSTALEPTAKKKKLTDTADRNFDMKLVLAKPKSKSALLLDKLIKKNSIDRAIENIVKDALDDVFDDYPYSTARRKSGEGKRRKSLEKLPSTPLVDLPMEIARKGRKNVKGFSPKWSNGWSWQGEPYQAKVYMNSTGTWGWRTCWQSMYHADGAAGVKRGDAVLLRASSRGAAPFVARVAHLWRDLDGEMMLSLVWYYRPEHTERGRQTDDAADEVFASRHRDSNSVACIDDKCYVLTYNEYCRYRKLVRAAEQEVAMGRSIVPPIPRSMPLTPCSMRYLRALPPLDISPDRVLFCRKVYDYRLKKIVKNPGS